MNEFKKQFDADMSEAKKKLKADLAKVFQTVAGSVAKDIAKATDVVREELDGLRGETRGIVERIEALEAAQ